MSSFEFERPETWSIGKRTGFLSIVLLIIGPVILVSIDSIFKSYSVFISVLTIGLIVFLLYMNYNIFLEKDSTRTRINHHILILWGAWQFISYFRLADYYMTYPSPHIPYTMITGLWLTAIGFLMCAIAGIMEWRYPLAMGPQILFRDRSGTIREEPAKSNPTPDTLSAQPQLHRKSVVGNPGPKAAAVPAGNPNSTNQIIDVLSREPKNKDEIILQRWARHIGADGKAYEQCIRCRKYGFITARESQGDMLFSCPSCGSSFTLKK
jgi:hypothetical protein